MQLGRRFLLGSASSAALLSATGARAQILEGAGKVLTGTGHVLMRPPVPASVGGLLNTQISLANPAGQPTQVSPYFSFGMPLAQAELPASGYKLALYDASGVTKIMDLQVDQRVTDWADGSHNYCVVSGYATGTTLAAGASATFTIKAETGFFPTTAVCTTTTLAASSDLKAVCKIGADTYTVSVNNIISLYSGAPGTHPQGTVKIWKSGPVSLEGAFGQYLKRDRDGASHMWAFLKVYVTALSASGPFAVRGLLENIQSFAANPGATIGANVGAPGIEVIDSIDFYNGSALIGALGGINDTRNMTFTSAGVSTATNTFTVTFPPGQVNGAFAIGFSSTGTLPAGLQPANAATYWPGILGTAGGFTPLISRWWQTRFIEGQVTHITTPVSGTTYSSTNKPTVLTVSGGGTWAVTTTGASSGQIPSGTGPTFTDGSLVWTLIGPAISSGGTGTHTMQYKAAITRASKCAAMAGDTYPFWNGAGALPKLLVGYTDFARLTTRTKSVLPLNPTITAVPWNGPLPIYSPNTIWLPGNTSYKDIGGTGESNVDERVNAFSPTAAASIYLPADAGHARDIRRVALSFMDRQGYCYRDENSQQVLAFNYGPDKIGGSYPGFGPSRPDVHLGANSGSNAIGINTSPSQWPGYGGDYFSVSVPETSHNPNPHYWPYMTSGDPLFFDAMLEYAVTTSSWAGAGAQVSTAVIGGVRYSWAWALHQQARAGGWQLKMFSQACWLCPDNHLAKPLLSDVMDDSAVIGLLWHQANVSTEGQAVGYVVQEYPTLVGAGGNLQNIEPWMHGYAQIIMAWEAWKGNRPGFKTFLENYYQLMWLRLFDSDRGGSEKLMDVQYVAVGNSININPPADGTWVTVPESQFADIKSVYGTTYPPPATAFIRGLQTQGSGVFTYWTGHIDASSYIASGRCACVMAAAAGIAVYDKVLTRIDALALAAGTPFLYIQPTGSGNLNGLMWAVAKPPP